MNQASSRIKQIFKKFNIFSVSFDDGLKICRRERINVVFYPMADCIKGYYSNVLIKKYRKKFIIINEKLLPVERWFVLLHELIHHFLHRSSERRQLFYCRAVELIESREELEARTFALMLMYPQKKLIELSGENLDYLSDYEQDLLVQRNFIYRNQKDFEN